MLRDGDLCLEALAPCAEPMSDELAAMPAHLAGCSECSEEATSLLLLAATEAGIDPADALHRLASR